MKTKVLMLMLVVLFINGCVTSPGWWNPKDDTIIGPEQYQALPPDEQALYASVTVKQIDPEVAGKVDAGIAAAEGVLQIVRPLIPEPFATGGLAVVSGLIMLWQLFSRAKIKDKFDAIKLGAVITAESADKVIRRSANLWKEFADRQDAGKANTNAIMPDEIARKL